MSRSFNTRPDRHVLITPPNPFAEDLALPTTSFFLAVMGCTLTIEENERSITFAHRVAEVLAPRMPDERDIVVRITVAIARVRRLTPARVKRATAGVIGRMRARELFGLSDFDPFR